MRGACGRQTYGLTAAATPSWWRWDGMGWARPWAETAAPGSTAPAGDRARLAAAGVRRGRPHALTFTPTFFVALREKRGDSCDSS